MRIGVIVLAFLTFAATGESPDPGMEPARSGAAAGAATNLTPAVDPADPAPVADPECEAEAGSDGNFALQSVSLPDEHDGLVDLMTGAAPGAPVAICRMAPECSTDEDCDFLCGPGLGRCAHSRCPVRVCRCR